MLPNLVDFTLACDDGACGGPAQNHGWAAVRGAPPWYEQHRDLALMSLRLLDI